MNYQEFISSVTGFLRESLPYDTELNLVPLEKNNGVVKDGLSVRKRGQNIAPTIYLDSYYRDYLAGRSLENIYTRILESCEDCTLMEQFDVSFFSDYEKIRPTIVYKLINLEKNRELLEKVPHIPFLNLSIVFYSLLRETPVGNATVLIHNSHLDMWKLDTKSLYREARKNTKKILPAELKSMAEMVRELSGDQGIVVHNGVPMYVLTNEKRALGAACILYDGILEKCAGEIGESYYVLPSSIHEVILIPKSVVFDPQELEEMVRDINKTQVQRTEVLADCVYYYDTDTKRLSVVEDL